MVNTFRTPLAGELSQGQTPPIPGTNGTEWRILLCIQQKTAGLSQGRFWFVPETGPVCPRDAVAPKMFMFIGPPCLKERWQNRQTSGCPARFLQTNFGTMSEYCLEKKRPWLVRGLLGTDPPRTSSSNPPRLPLLRVDLASIRHRFDIDSASIS